MPAATAKSDVFDRCQSVEQSVYNAFRPLIAHFAGQSMRPSGLARALKIDRTLAARIVRSVRAEGGHAATLRECPAPGGLRIIVDAARRAGAPDTLTAPAAHAADTYERLILDFPGGRSALEAVLASRDGELRERNQRASMQAIHRAMSSLVGYQADTMLATVILAPGSDEHRCDAIYILGKLGVRRLRDSAPITVFGFRASHPDYQRIETADTRPDPEHGAAYLLPEFCTQPLPPVSLFRSEGTLLATLAESVPAVNQPVSVVASVVHRDAGARFASDDAGFHSESHVCRWPCRVLLADLLIHDDLFAGAEPIVSSTLQGITSGGRRPDLPEFQLDRIDLDLPLVNTGRGIDALGTPDVPNYPRILRSVLDRRGLKPERFRSYRLRVLHPVPLVSYTLWIPLPPPPPPPSEYSI